MKRLNESFFRHIFTVLALFTCCTLCAQKNTGAYHALGNGQYCVYEQGISMKEIFGPPYSSPSYIQTYLKDSNITVISVREYGTAIWKHTLKRNGKPIAEVTDFVDSQLPVMVRKIKAFESVSFVVEVQNTPEVRTFANNYDYPGESAGALLIHKERGLYFMQDYAHPYEQFHQLLVRNQATIQAAGKSGHFLISVQPGESEIYFVGGPEYKECIENSRKILSSGFETIYNRTSEYWGAFTARRKDFNVLIPNTIPDKKQILEQIDNVSVLLKTQQATDGAVLAGHYFHMAYVRDQYGVSRGLLALGYYEEARKILDFYWKIWEQFGVLHNAQAIGIPGIFHIHENDEVEQTGYLIIQAFDYLKKSNDSAFVRMILPMLNWAWKVQKRNLVKDMLPFNGDETYVAGAILPRTALNDGSAEATLMFIKSGELLLPYLQTNQLADPDSLGRDKMLLAGVRQQYRSNFIKAGKLITNNPDRMTIAEMPQFRHGVCAGWHGILWTEKDSNGNYLCPRCHEDGKVYGPIDRKYYYLSSITLAFVFIDSDMIPGEIKENINQIKRNYVEQGSISSRPGIKSVIGYEYGFLLYALTKYNDPVSKQVYQDMMSVIDESGAWTERYEDGKPDGCRYRPWESAINIEALIQYCTKK